MTTERPLHHQRQISLPEIGEAGQERLESSEVVLTASGDARDVEATYLRLAGVIVVDHGEPKVSAKTKTRSARKPSLKPSTNTKLSARALAKANARAQADVANGALEQLGLRAQAARDVADGALRALVGMRAVLGIGEEKTEDEGKTEDA